MSSPLLPPEQMALTVARAQIKRGEDPSPNITAVLIMALARLIDKIDDEETQLQAIVDAWTNGSPSQREALKDWPELYDALTEDEDTSDGLSTTDEQ